jgi:signal transduction histidine kinase/CheY-like chemotaxis protein/HPt (histidine-containing phosphotransfer) domain-containing protein
MNIKSAFKKPPLQPLPSAVFGPPDAMLLRPPTIKWRIFLSLGLTLSALLATALVSYSLHTAIEFEGHIRVRAAGLQRMLQLILDKDAEVMGSLLDVLQQQPCVQTSWQMADRAALLACVRPLFEGIRLHHQMTHLYFYTPEQIVFLRAHNPPRFGDRTDPFALQEAVRQGKIVHGLELGPASTLTLRVAAPCYFNGHVLGYVELGADIGHITAQISATLGLDLLLAVDKQRIYRSVWEEGQVVVGHQGNWTRFADWVVIDHSARFNDPNVDVALARALTSPLDSTFTFQYAQEGRQGHRRELRGSVLPLTDIRGQHIGRIIMALEAVRAPRGAERLPYYLVLVFILVGALLSAFFWLFLDRIERHLRATYQALASRIHTQERSEQQLRQHQLALENEVQRRKGVERDLEARVQLLAESRAATLNMMEDMEIARSQAEAASRAKSAFLATMSHEIRTPMNGVLGMAELLADTPLNQEQREYLDVIYDSGRALLTVINDILDFSKVEAGRLDLDPIAFDLEQAIYDVARLLAPRAEEKGLELILDYDIHCPRQLLGDVGRIRQILLNLIGNAIKFTGQGHVLVRVSGIMTTPERVGLSIEIHDTGIGIAPEHLQRLFEPFTQADGSTTRKYGGTGLGLAISQRLLELMGGRIEVQSTLGVGSIFVLSLELPLSAPAATLPQVELAGVKVLVVDDNRVNRRVLSTQLRGFGMQVEEVADAAEALVALRQAVNIGQPFDIAVLDHHMPDQDGESLALEIRADPALCSLTRVLLTSAGERGDAERLYRAGFSAYLAKPVQGSVLRRTLAGALGLMRQGGTAPLITRHRLIEETPALDGGATLQGRILLVEDVLANQKVALAMLRRLGLTVTLAANGQEALTQWAIGDFDAILMDCQMPELDGYQATRCIREQETKGSKVRVPIIALTANALPGERQRCLEAGMDDYITKPFEYNGLATILRQWLPGITLSNAGDHATIAARDSLPTTADDTRVTLNLGVLARQRAAMGEDFDDLIAAFQESVRDILEALPTALAAGDAKLVERLAHSMKSASANVGAVRLMALSRELEAEARAGLQIGRENPSAALRLEFTRVCALLPVSAT